MSNNIDEILDLERSVEMYIKMITNLQQSNEKTNKMFETVIGKRSRHHKKNIIKAMLKALGIENASGLSTNELCSLIGEAGRCRRESVTIQQVLELQNYIDHLVSDHKIPSLYSSQLFKFCMTNKIFNPEKILDLLDAFIDVMESNNAEH